MSYMGSGPTRNDEDVSKNKEDENIHTSSKEKQIPNYTQYLTDSNIQHTLYEDLTHKRHSAFKLKGEKYDAKDWKEMLLETCDILGEIDKEIIINFPKDPVMNGKKITYFAFKEEEIERAPKKLKNLELYISTNHSANSIRNIVINILRAYKIPVAEYKVYFRADYSELHD